LLIGCAAVIQEKYSDQYVNKDSRYVNDSLGFSLTFNDSWRMYPNTASMPGQIQGIARAIADEGGELIYFALSKNGSLGARATVEDIDLPLEQFYKVIFEVNSDELDKQISYDIVKMGRENMVKWVYQAGQMTYQEYQVKRGKYNIRMTFWVFSALYDDYKDEFYKIASTYKATGK
jgi:hypothetical protein